MNILVIGNGFDLAHELPTKYPHFLEFIKVIMKALSKGKLAGVDWGNTDSEVQNLLISNKGNVQENLFSNKQRWEELINNNFWIEYFLSIYTDKEKDGKDGWIDFEGEISKVIQSLDDDISTFDFEDNTQLISNTFLNERYYDATPPITYKQLRDKLLIDLNKLIRAFEIYLAEYVEKIDCKLVSPDIQEILPKKYNKMNTDDELYVLSFNYTNTYQRIYNKVQAQMYAKSNIDYIHGKADINNTIKSNNMVLGIDEYLPKKRRNKETEFIAFKKFYQRIHKQTGCEYRKWIKQIIQKNKTYKEEFRLKQLDYERNRGMGNEGYQTIMNLKKLEENPPKHNLYFFGHSLDITDKDILRELILTENVHTTIFYVNEDVMGQQIANLVKVIGQDELIRRTGEKTIEFKPQQKMEPIDR